MSCALLRCLVTAILTVRQVRFRFSLPARLVLLAPDSASGFEEASPAIRQGVTPARLGNGAGLLRLFRKLSEQRFVSPRIVFMKVKTILGER
jgi:hypothetical protein